MKRGHQQIHKLTTQEVVITTDRTKILEAVDIFYTELYSSQKRKIRSEHRDPRAPLRKHLTEDLPEISLYEIKRALKLMKKGKFPGADKITYESLQIGGSQF